MLVWCQCLDIAVLWEELVGSRDAHAPSFCEVEVVMPIIVKGWATVPGINALWSPGHLCESGGMNDGTGAWRRQWVRASVIFVTM